MLKLGIYANNAQIGSLIVDGGRIIEGEIPEFLKVLH